MFQLRGSGEMDCAANPNDPVCAAYYGTTPTGPTSGYQNKIIQAIANGSIVNVQWQNQQNAQGAATAGANVVLQAGGASPLATSASGLTSLFSKIPWWIKFLAVVGGGYLAYKHFKKPKAG